MEIEGEENYARPFSIRWSELHTKDEPFREPSVLPCTFEQVKEEPQKSKKREQKAKQKQIRIELPNSWHHWQDYFRYVSDVDKQSLKHYTQCKQRGQTLYNETDFKND